MGCDKFLLNAFLDVYPYMDELMESYRVPGPRELIVVLKNGRHLSFDAIFKLVRDIPPDPNDLTESEFRVEFAHRFKHMLWKTGVTQEELSRRTGLSQPQISGYMTGRNIPSFYIIDKIAKALDCSTDDFRYL